MRFVRIFALASFCLGFTMNSALAQQPKVRGMGDSEAATALTQANEAYAAKDYPKAAAAYESALKAGAKSPVVSYNAACCYALIGKSDDAFRCLDLALDAGWRDVDHMKVDTDLNSLHNDARWAKAVKRAEEASEKYAKSIKEPALRAELLKRMQEDQRIRMAENPNLDEWKKIDAANTAYMKTVIDKYGWPGTSMVGEDGALAVFLMIQHADADPAFQKRCLELLKKAVDAKEASAGHWAYLTDRVLLADGKKQLYGTQFQMVDGELKPRPIEDEANVDKRRAEVGLPTLAEYAAQMKSRERPAPAKPAEKKEEKPDR